MNLARLTELAAATVTATQRQLPPAIRPLALAVPVHYEAAPHPSVLAEGFEPDILGLFSGNPHGPSWPTTRPPRPRSSSTSKTCGTSPRATRPSSARRPA